MDVANARQYLILKNILDSTEVPAEISQGFVNDILDKIAVIQPECIDMKTQSEMIVREAQECLVKPYVSGNIEVDEGKRVVLKLLILFALRNKDLWDDAPCSAVNYLLSKFGGILTIADVRSFVERYL